MINDIDTAREALRHGPAQLLSGGTGWLIHAGPCAGGYIRAGAADALIRRQEAMHVPMCVRYPARRGGLLVLTATGLAALRPATTNTRAIA